MNKVKRSWVKLFLTFLFLGFEIGGISDHGVLTMTTCYPFNTPGYYPDRYIVSAALINSK